MFQQRKTIFLMTMAILTTASLWAQIGQWETLNRGVVAVAVPDSGNYVSWRLLANDPDSVRFNVYRNAVLVNPAPLAASTNLMDQAGSAGDNYTIVPVLDGVEGDASAPVQPWGQNYLSVPLQRPAGGTTPTGESYTYSPNDASVADLDGDNEYELVLKWDPSNSKDNSQAGYTGNVYLDGLEMDGTLLWRIDLGRNIRAGAHYTQFMVYDLDGDGKAEVACKTADATVDAGGTVIGDSTADYRNSSGYVLSGPEYFTIFDGQTGVALATTNYLPPRGSVSAWGDDYGNRVDRFLAGVAYLDGQNPSVVMCRGYYTRTVLAAWDWRGGQLTSRWVFDTDNGYPTYTGQGNHQLSVADLDQDGRDEIIYGSIAVDDDGTGLWNAGLGHGDALHVSDMDPNRDGLEIWGIHEVAQIGSALLDGRTGQMLWFTGPGDIGRGVAANVDPSQEGMECWGGTDGLRSVKNQRVGGLPPSANHVVWWDGDLNRELLDGNNIRKYGGNHPVLLLADGCSSNNGTKSNPALQADLFGDWREEVIWRTSDNLSLRIYTTTAVTPYRLKTLMHDRQYRLAVAWQNVGYNQPPHTSYYVGASMFIPDSLRPPSTPLNVRGTAWEDTVLIEWDANTDSDLAGYRIHRGTRRDNLTITLDVATATSYLDANVTNDTTYYYAVSAYDLDGNESVYSDTIRATPSNRPPTPTEVGYRNDGNSVLLVWSYPDLDLLDGFKVYRSRSADLSSPEIHPLSPNDSTFLDTGLIFGIRYYYALSVVDTNLVESVLSEILGVAPGFFYTHQAEDGNLSGGVLIESNHIGYRGSGFANFAANNSAVEFTHMPGFGGGERTLVIRYALGNTARTGNLIVNGNASALTMRNTGEWTNYVTDSVAVTLNPGYDNTIRFETTGNDFGNLDEVTILPQPLTAIEPSDGTIPIRYKLFQNQPNPFNPATLIRYHLPHPGRVQLAVYNIIGQRIIYLVDEEQRAGEKMVRWDGMDQRGRPVGSGIYIYRLQVGDFVESKQMLLVR